MNASTSEYSGGCESGWTMYFDQLSTSADQCNRSMPLGFDCRSKGVYVNEDDEDENSSMLSDASSGPPHFHQDEGSSEETRYNSTISASEVNKGKHKKKAKEHRKTQQNFHLDDTASSPAQSFSKNNALLTDDKYLIEHGSGISRGFSATQSKEKSVLRKHFGFLKPSHDRKS
ncbi:protein SOB FIVE-LIKE 5-like [Coffea arabica]|uniref:Protein SOB FIVE-LIKE 5-like n=1 Tax=Coffea arabica TaxID=13443 RepID=A0A6P6US15_COFAR|nr:uncharacterized protein LOC113712993 [Coffea arabica]